MKISETYRTPTLASIGVSPISLATDGLAEKLDIGKRKYESVCAVCHGLNGKGDDSPLKPLLAKPVPNLTVPAKNNHGVFPFDRVYRIIDGRQEVKSHGPRNMPVWGSSFNNQTSLYFENYPPQVGESATRGRIPALTEYLYRLRE